MSITVLIGGGYEEADANERCDDVHVTLTLLWATHEGSSTCPVHEHRDVPDLPEEMGVSQTSVICYILYTRSK